MQSINRKSLVALLLVTFALVTSTSAQRRSCHSTVFEAHLSGGNRYEHELGKDIWFSAFPDKGRWTMRVGPGREQTHRFDVGWSLDWSWNEDWELGSTHGRTSEAAMRSSPRRLWFALSEADYRRLIAARRQELSSDSRVVFSKESFEDAKKSISKGLAEVSILDYSLSDTEENIVSATLRVKVVTPTSFPLTNSAHCECPSEFSKPKSAQSFIRRHSTGLPPSRGRLRHTRL
jgi:hypothetical protein